MNFKFVFLSCIFFALVLIGCSSDSGGSDGSTPNSVAGSIGDTAAELATASKEITAQILVSESEFGTSLLSSNSPSYTSAFAGAGSIMRQTFDTETKTETDTGNCGGTVVSTCTTSYSDENIYPWSMDCHEEFNDYCYSFETDGNEYEIVYNGTLYIYMEYTDNATGFSEYMCDISYTSTFPYYPTGSINYAERCQTNNGVETCSTGVYESDTTTYYTSDVSVSGNSSTGYNVSYTMIDSDENTYTVTFTGLTLCENGNIGSGSGTVAVNNDTVISIEFTSCDEFAVTYNGNTETFSQ